MIVYLIIGFLLATIGMTILNCVGELISVITELIKAHISVGIMTCNDKIDKLHSSQEETNTRARAIGFATTFEEDEEHDE